MSPVPASACPDSNPRSSGRSRRLPRHRRRSARSRRQHAGADDLQQAHRHNGQQQHQEDIQAPPSQHGTGHHGQQLASRSRSTPYVAAPVPPRSRNQQIDKSANGRRHQEEAKGRPPAPLLHPSSIHLLPLQRDPQRSATPHWLALIAEHFDRGGRRGEDHGLLIRAAWPYRPRGSSRLLVALIYEANLFVRPPPGLACRLGEWCGRTGWCACAMDASARPRSWRTFGPRRLRRQSQACLAATHRGAA